MCGLVGVITKTQNGFNKEQVDAFDNLLYIDALRGMDSTGVFLVDREGNMDLAKEATPSFYYRMDEAYKNLQRTAFQKGRAMIGHNRAATKGTVIDENAHPFVVDDRITLVHNGTLWGDFTKLTDQKVDVDSHAIAHKIHECGDDVEKALQQVDGAFALIWHDFKHNTLNFVRNAQRPLHWVETPNSYLWASEANMLEWILARYKWKAEKPITELAAGTLVTYDFSHSTWKVDSKKIVLEAPKPVTTYYNNRRWDSRANAWTSYTAAEDEDGWDGSTFNLHPVCAMPSDRVATPAANVAAVMGAAMNPSRFPMQETSPQARAVLTGRTIAKENELAAKWSMDVTAESFNQINSEIALDQEWTKGCCIDFEQVKPGTSAYGFFLYAQSNKSCDFMIKVFLPPNTADTDLLAWCLDGTELEFHVVSRQWRCYTDAKNGQGFAILNADLCRASTTLPKDTINA